MHKVPFGLLTAIGLFACSPQEAGNADENGVAASQVAGGKDCVEALGAEPDRQSFANWTEGVVGSAEDLTAFAAKAGMAFRKAAADMCQAGSLDAKRIAPFRRLLVQNGSGATETAVYTDPAFGEETLVFQWIFVEDGWNLPEQADIQQGIACWADPDQPVCAERLP